VASDCRRLFTPLCLSTPSYCAAALPAEHVRAPSGLFGRRSYFVELFTGSYPWSNTEFWQFSEKRLKTELFASKSIHSAQHRCFMILRYVNAWLTQTYKSLLFHSKLQAISTLNVFKRCSPVCCFNLTNLSSFHYCYTSTCCACFLRFLAACYCNTFAEKTMHT